MTQEDKDLLLKDLSARLPYGVMMTNIELCETHYPLTCEDLHDAMYEEDWDDVPYLRPMSSMTEEEKKELKSATCPEGTGYFDEQYLICPMSHFGEHISYDFMSDILNWLNAHHFDYRNLVERGLAIAVTEENNPYK